MHLLVVASVELSAARTAIPSGAAPTKAREASPEFRGGARALLFVGCCLASIQLDWTGVSPRDAPLFEIDGLSNETEPTTIGNSGACQSPQWQLLRIDCGALQLAGNWPA
jgi:hypothetical protein